MDSLELVEASSNLLLALIHTIKILLENSTNSFSLRCCMGTAKVEGSHLLYFNKN